MAESDWKLAPEAMSEAQRRVYDEIAAGPRKSVPTPFHVLLASPRTAEHAQRLGAFLRYDSELPRPLYELAVLVTAEAWGAGYEWSVHAISAAREGVPAEVIEAIRHGKEPAFADPDMALIWRFASTFHRTRRIPPDLAEAAIARFGKKAAVELTAILGYYAFLAMQLGLADIRVTPWPFPGDGPT
ncbi:MAG TPA: carboxymuconolactone decarboxylase family protein [Hyphomicrobiales bacterium]|nr:carboxymuconolactone decarboxylase family protein [Hyphomicrobiales bacterium]